MMNASKMAIYGECYLPFFLFEMKPRERKTTKKNIAMPKDKE